MEEEMLKDDPLKKPKKITVALLIIALAVMMVMTFAVFHWLYSDYFTFKANEVAANDRLKFVLSRCAEEESAAKKRLVEIEEKAEESETAALVRIQDAEKESRARIDRLNSEYDAKREAKIAEYKKLSDELDASLKAKKEDIATLLRGYKERFDVSTNDIECTIALKNAELAEKKRQVAQLPDLKKQFDETAADLASAREQRDAAWAEASKAKADTGTWNAKVEAARVQLVELEKQTKELATLRSRIQKENAEAQSNAEKLRAESQALQEEILSATTKLEGLQRQASAEGAKIEELESSRSKTEQAMNAALDRRRLAESDRDRAEAEAAQAEANWKKRKPEIEGLIKDMERILEMKTQSVNAAQGGQGK